MLTTASFRASTPSVKCNADKGAKSLTLSPSHGYVLKVTAHIMHYKRHDLFRAKTRRFFELHGDYTRSTLLHCGHTAIPYINTLGNWLGRVHSRLLGGRGKRLCRISASELIRVHCFLGLHRGTPKLRQGLHPRPVAQESKEGQGVITQGEPCLGRQGYPNLQGRGTAHDSKGQFSAAPIQRQGQLM